MPISFFVSMYFISFVSVVGIIRYKYLGTSLRYIEWYVISSTVSGWIEHVLGSYYHIHTLWLFHFNTFIDLLLVLIALYYWRTDERNGKFIRWSFYFYMVIWITGMFTFEPLTMSDDYSGSIAQLIQLSFSIWLLMVVLKDDKIIWSEDPRFWVSSGVIIYVAFTFLLFGLFDVMLSRSFDILRAILHINWYAVVISNAFILRAFFCKPASTSKNLISNSMMNS
jgi:hypothetical protein